MGYDFDIQNFGIGLAAGWASAYAVYRARHALGAMRRAVTQQATSAQMSATRSADSRYINDMIERCETTHLAGQFVNLSKIVVEPRFITASEFAEPPEDEVTHDVFYVVPRFPDHPYLHAPFNIETLSIEELSRGDRTLALIGLPGSGRTTALLTIALWSLGRVRFEQPKDKVQEQLDQEEAALSKEERTRRAKERMAIEQRAKERLAEERGEELDGGDRPGAVAPLFQRLLPIYVHLANMTLGPGAYGKEVDPAEPLVRAVQYQMKRVTAKTLPRNVYNRLNKGQALVLIDGFDDLAEPERKAYLAWLEAFVKEYRRNFIIVAGPAEAYGFLTRTGLTPVILRPWSDLDAQRGADNWAQNWPDIVARGKKRRRSAALPSENLVVQAKTDTRSLSPFHLTLKFWETYGNAVAETGYEQWLDGFLTRHIPPKLNTEQTRKRLSLAAALQLNEGFISPARLEAVLVEDIMSGGSNPVSPQPQPTSNPAPAVEAVLDADEVFAAGGEDDENVDALFEKSEDKPADSLPAQTEKPSPAQAQKDAPKLGKEVARLLAALLKSGLLIVYRGRRYQFRHPEIAAYLASLTLQPADEDILARKAFDPAWRSTVGYAALKTSIEAAVNARQSAPADILNSSLLEIAHWMPFAGAKAEWRAQVLRQLGNLLVAPSQYTLVRERTAAALITTRDRGAVKIFRVALRNPNPEVRRLACLGMGALGAPESVPDVAPLVRDPVLEVQLAAGMALGAIRTQEALEVMIDALTTGTEQLRQAIAEAFAAIPEDGYPVLYDAIQHEEMMLRRAAVFGLRRVKTAWSLIAIYRAFLEDTQWYVRSAAQQAFQDMQYGASEGPTAYPAPEAIPWLGTWMERLGEDAPKDQSPDDILAAALEDRDPLVRALSAANLGQLGLAAKASALYAALYDPEEFVRDAAHRSLGDLQLQTGKPLPAPN